VDSGLASSTGLIGSALAAGVGTGAAVFFSEAFLAA